MSGVDKAVSLRELVEKGWREVMELSDSPYLVRPPVGVFADTRLQNKTFHVYAAEELQALLFDDEDTLLD